MVVEIVFWVLSVLIVYVYGGYPLLLAIASAVRSRATAPEGRSATDDTLPRVTLLISAFNEAGCIAEKLDNTLGLDYPKERLEVVVISDASDDGTDEIVSAYQPLGIRLLRMAERGGKTSGLNAGVVDSEGDVLVFSDANAMYDTQALKYLTAPFQDPSVGAVIGESSYLRPDTESGRSESLYWRYETWVKAMESRRGSVVGGDGAIYSVRRELYVPMAAHALSDFVNPLQVVKAGYRCVYEPRALSYEEAAADFAREFRRKVRIVNRAWRALWSMREMLDPFRYGAFAMKLWSHKFLRWLMPVALLGVLIANAFLIGRHPGYVLFLALQATFYALAMVGFLFRHRARQSAVIRIPFYFCLVNVAAARGLWEAMDGKSYTTWTTARVGG